MVAAACGTAIGAKLILQCHTRGLRPIFFGWKVIMEFTTAKITRKDVEAFQAEQDAADMAKAERRSLRQPSFSKRGNEVSLIVEEAHKRQNIGPLTKLLDIGGRDETCYPLSCT